MITIYTFDLTNEAKEQLTFDGSEDILMDILDGFMRKSLVL